MITGLERHVLRTAQRLVRGTRRALTDRLRPTSAFGGVVADFFRSRHQLLAENALLRQQLIVVSRRVKRPKLRPVDRLAMLLAAARTPLWPNATIIIKR
jgi:hypothetical protein